MSYLIAFVISLCISLACSYLSSLFTKTKTNNSQAGDLDAPTAEEGIPIMHIRGTRFVNPNCIWWTPTDTSSIRK